jgi:hypothetical protein
MFVSRVGRGLMWVGVLIVLLGATTSGPSVTIADGALTPPVVTVPAGGSVLWTNRGTRQHAIVAVGGAFPPFSLAPEGTRSVAFMKPGKYPYQLDGAVIGAVFVVGPGGGGGSGTGGQSGAGGQSSTCHLMGDATLTIYRYDVRVAVHRERTPSDSREQRTVIDWKASWVAPMSVIRCGGIVEININAVHGVTRGGIGVTDVLPGGQFDVTLDLNEPGCHYTYTATNLPAVMHLAVEYDNPGQSNFDFLAGLDFGDDKATSEANFERENDVRVAACGAHHPGRTSNYTLIGDGDTSMPLNGFNGVLIGDNQLHLTFLMPPNSPVDAPILESLAAGKGFNYDTGMQLYQDKYGNSERVRATVSFSRLEN